MTEPISNGFTCNRVGGGHQFGSKFCPECKTKKPPKDQDDDD